MSRAETSSSVLTIRIDPELKASLDREAERQHTSKSELVRRYLVDGLTGGKAGADLAREARRQSLLVSRHPTEGEVLDFLEGVTDRRGWT